MSGIRGGDYTQVVIDNLSKRVYSRKQRVYGITHHYLIAVVDKNPSKKYSWIMKCPYCNRWFMQLNKHVEQIHPEKTYKELVRDFWDYEEYPKCVVCGEDIPPRSLNQMGPRIYGVFCHSTCTATVKAELGINPLQKDNRPKGDNGEDLYTMKGVKTRIEMYGTNSNWCHKSNSIFGFDSTYEDKFWMRQLKWKHHCVRMTEVIPYRSSASKFRTYQPDFIFHKVKINGKPLVIEVKSDYTYNSDADVDLKLAAAIKKGYSIIIIDPRIADGKYWPRSLKDCRRIYDLEMNNLKESGVMIPEYYHD